ncbi:MBOAT family O-acyltransferase [Rubrimonas cliftonensis]|uniref:Probable alginate O-acetylase AlgI n=1 Tax=Rubrimonas cliftonensis TaxID=89524 RepID=A0A1H4CWE3_9RHOB|nr:MBOAT family O-acyltransferase [Rubrimonas cliftonensis]SEA64412.1 D-alanyl-lipoteichoic acid acyltransferase DltB, MBOAT superfamily [Rubrimonas cliftonensis]
MLFNSLEFIFIFLPFTLAFFYGMLFFGLRRYIFVFTVIASSIFYAVWNPPYLLLLGASVAGNYGVGVLLDRLPASRARSWVFGLGVAANLALLGWFKYTNFFINNLNSAGFDFTAQNIILPLAISFYTFQQIAYLADVARREVRPAGIWRYATFVVFFPQLIAGPIVHYKDMVPQFFGRHVGRFMAANLTVGLAIFAIGLFKKTVIADTAAGFSTPVYAAAAAGEPIGLLAGWTAAIAYTVQLYFDFSGYSDMAIGLARMFGIVLPVNFHSPLRAASVIDYWRRWHITLQQFIVTYMYQPLVLPLSRFAAEMRLGRWASFGVTVALPTVILFTVIGLWHGAAWTFVLFGLMHGTYLAVNEAWRETRRRARRKPGGAPTWLDRLGYHALTLLAVIAANVMFRAADPGDAVAIWAGMLRFDQLPQIGAALPATAAEAFSEPAVFLALAWALILLGPNTQQIMGRYRPILAWRRWRGVAAPAISLTWRPTPVWAVATAAALFLGVAFVMRGQSEFIYFNF